MVFTPIQEQTYSDTQVKMLKAAPILLIEGKEAAMQAVDIGERQLSRWLNDPFFLEVLSELRGDAVRETSMALGRLGTKAVAALGDVLDNPRTAPQVKIKAAEIVIGKLLAFRELNLSTQKIESLERQLEELRAGE